ncbi:MAG: fasciclin domain-containing protein [Planctomycetota bacterium]|jgi:uncharacterized surface protein with fasciclin (FAS1) repeats
MKSKRMVTIMSVLLVGLVLAAGPAWGRHKPDHKPGPTIVQVVIQLNTDEDGDFFEDFDTLIAAIGAADPTVVETLTGNGQFTVFGPTDDAFDLLGLNKDNIGDFDQETLTDILLYHVARGRRYSEDVSRKGYACSTADFCCKMRGF